MTSAPGSSTPRSSASSMSSLATRSLLDPSGLKYSSFAKTRSATFPLALGSHQFQKGRVSNQIRQILVDMHCALSFYPETQLVFIVITFYGDVKNLYCTFSQFVYNRIIFFNRQSRNLRVGRDSGRSAWRTGSCLQDEKHPLAVQVSHPAAAYGLPPLCGTCP